MPRPPARLANCYVPLPLETSCKDAGSSAGPKRLDRKNDELRQLHLETGVISNQALGSSLVEIGHTKVLCQVMVGASPDAVLEQGHLECKVRFAPHVGLNAIAQRSQAVTPLESTVSSGKLHSESVAKESSLSSQLHSALIPTIPIEKFPKCAIQVHATILQDDGSTLSACITAASLALADAHVEMFDVVASCTVAVLVDSDGENTATFLADPTEDEILRATALMCLAMTPNHKEVTLWSQSGRLDSARANEAIELCRNGCRTMHRFMRQVWISQAS